MNNFYVYMLIDPRNNLPFYIGKGQIIDKYNRKYRRFKDHLSDKKGNNKFKINVINKILEENKEVGFNIVQDNLNELESFEIEKQLILKYGLRINNEGILTNLTMGGEGSSGYKHTDETKNKQSCLMKKILESKTANFKGCRHSTTTRIKMSESQQLYNTNNPDIRKGRKLNISQENREKHIELTKRRWKALSPHEFKKFGVHGERNGSAKSYIFTNSDGTVFSVKGSFKKFIKENKLSLATFKKYLNRGVIPPPIDITHNRMTTERINSTGWEVKLN